MKWKRIKYFLAVFIVMLLLRLAYGYYTTSNEPRTRNSRGVSNVPASDFFQEKRNYASDQYLLKSGRTAQTARPPEGMVDQKYEKTAAITTATDQFERDEAAIRKIIDDFKGIVQYEQSSGRPDLHTKLLQLMIGVQPENFDGFCEAVKAIGSLENLVVTKTDKTNEFLNLKAQRASLETTRSALNELKRMEGKIDELVGLQFRILEIDRQLKDLGVKLGDYDEVNEFCTVRFTMYESYNIVIVPLGFPYRLFVAFTWTVKYYFAVALSLAFFSVFAALSLVIAEQIRKWAAVK